MNQRFRARISLARIVVGVLAAALLAAAPAGAATPSPADWRDVVIYQIVTDRFADGNAANNAVEGNYAPADGAKIHGGDFAGIQQKLDYLVNLGVGAIWISPVVLNANAEYHGYAARDFFAIAPHFGTLAELQALSAACHARGIYLVIDVVVNHMGDLVDSGSSGYPTFKYPSTYTLRWRNASNRYPGFFDDLTKFHAHGGIQNYVDPDQIYGELFGLDDLKTDDPAVEAQLESAAEWLIENTDCDGFRIDTVKHVDMPFWQTWSPAVHGWAAAHGKSSFFFFGEVFDGDDAKVGSYTGTVGGGPYKLDSVLHYPMYNSANGVFAFDAPPSVLSARYAQLSNYDPTSREQLVTFLDNHDNSRFLGSGYANQDESRLRNALGWLLTSRGVPCIYYGTEQEFDGGGDPYDREDMWDGQWDFGPSDGDNFDLVHPSFEFTRRLLELRARHESLRRGTTLERTVESSNPGLYVYERRTASDTTLVAINTANAPFTVTQPTAWPSGAVVADALAPEAPSETVGAGGTVTLRIPARGVKVFESLAASAEGAAVARLHVTSTYPGHDQNLNDRWSPLRVRFDRAIDPARLPAAFHIAPATPGAWQVAADGRSASFFPASAWSAGTSYAWSFDTTLASVDGRRMPAAYAATFRFQSPATGIAVAAGFVADRIARQGLVAPQGIVATTDGTLLTDTGRDRLFTLTAGGDLGHWIGDSRWTRSEGVALAPDGRTSVIDESGLYFVDAQRIVTKTVNAAAAFQTGAGAWGGAAYSSRLYLGDPSNDRVVYVTAANSLATFASGVLGAEGLAFGPGGAWGSDLYVADANLTSLGASANGQGRIVRVSPAGVVSNFVVSPGTLNGASALAFDPTGRFGGNLFVADILNERILQITPAGVVTVFATGFNNLAGSQCLAFGSDGALYVCDPGSGESFSNTHGTQQPQVIRIAPAALTTDVSSVTPRLELQFAPPIPNPARERVTFTFTLPEAGTARLDLLDIGGRRLQTLASGSFSAGSHSVEWAFGSAGRRRVAPGIYFAVIESSGRRAIRRMLVVN